MWKAVPNILTFARLVMSVIFLVMILYSPQVNPRATFLDVAFVLFLIAGLTDVVDGHIARRFDATSKFGRMIDPLADKVLVCGAFICLAVIGEPKLFGLSTAQLAVIHWSVVVILLAREVYVTVLRHIAEAKGINFAATASGKVKMLLQSFAIGTVLVKMAHVPTAAWGSWFTALTFIAMVTATVSSGILATRRPSWQKLKAEGRPQGPTATST